MADDDGSNWNARIAGVAMLLVMVATAGVMGWHINKGIEEDMPDPHDPYLEDQCNQAFDYDWEYYKTLDESASAPGNVKILCVKHQGFMASTSEVIEVPKEEA